MDSEVSTKLIQIREQLAKHSVDAYVITRNDPHMVNALE